MSLPRRWTTKPCSCSEQHTTCNSCSRWSSKGKDTRHFSVRHTSRLVVHDPGHHRQDLPLPCTPRLGSTSIDQSRASTRSNLTNTTIANRKRLPARRSLNGPRWWPSQRRLDPGLESWSSDPRRVPCLRPGRVRAGDMAMLLQEEPKARAKWLLTSVLPGKLYGSSLSKRGSSRVAAPHPQGPLQVAAKLGEARCREPKTCGFRLIDWVRRLLRRSKGPRRRRRRRRRVGNNGHHH
mmetsp:Transcript_27386/g.79890  ORF Transcript_27386/g.79890 Transcript_27386/m.79890 type:complete len:236 (-) Transcript_27386:3263-3970(-)